MVIDGKIITSQSQWESVSPQVQSALIATGIVIISDEEWNAIGQMLKQSLREREVNGTCSRKE